MKWLIDENADFRIGKYLIQSGHNVTSIVNDYPRSITDQEVLAIAIKENRTIITEDRDFINLVSSKEMSFPGVVLFNLGSKDSIGLKRNIIEDLTSRLASLKNTLVIVSGNDIHIRHLSAPDQN